MPCVRLGCADVRHAAPSPQPPDSIPCCETPGSRVWTHWAPGFHPVSPLRTVTRWSCNNLIFFKCYLSHKATDKMSAYAIQLIGQSKGGRKPPEQLIDFSYPHFLASFPPVFVVLFRSCRTAVSVPIKSLRNWIIIRSWLERKWVRAKAWESILLNLVKN